MCGNKFLIRKFIEINDKIISKNLEKATDVDGVVVKKDIPYIDDGNTYHLLDVVRPETDDKLPIIIDIHGGAWLFGTKEVNAPYCQRLAAQGFCVVNASYRLISNPDGVYPNMFSDIFAVFDWVYENAQVYGGDLNNVFLTGDSAGGHLACFTSCVNGDPDGIGKELGMTSKLKFRAVGLNCPAVNIERYRKIKLPIISHLYKLFFGEEGKKHKYSRLVSLQNLPLDKMPPAYLITAYGDFMRFDVKFLKKELDKAGVENELFYPKKREKNKLAHVYSVLQPDWEESQAANKGMVSFFRKHIS